jgi:hypothetical protein
MRTDPGDPAEVGGATAAPSDGARETRSPHLELASRARALWRDLSWREASGSLGDLGTFLPLLVGLTVESGLDAGTTLIVTGVYNLITALCFDVPMPVQPMKTIAAVALSDASVTVPQIVAAGVFVSAAVFGLGVTGLIDTFNRIVPRAVVHGMQIGLGVLLCVRAFTMAVFHDETNGARVRPFLATDGLVVALAALLVATFDFARKTFRRCEPPACDDETERDVEDARVDGSGTGAGARRNRDSGIGFCCGFRSRTLPPDEDPSTTASSRSTPPTALLLVLAGLALSATKPGSLSSLEVGPTAPKLVTFTRRDVAAGILKAGLPQLPLTTLNSVVAVCALSKELFPDRPASPKRVATSVGLMNLAGAAAGVMPCCHGAGGLAAHYHFGARRGAATAFLGFCKLFLGALFGGSLLTLLRAFPKTVLGVMLGAASVELVRAAVGAFLGNRTARGGATREIQRKKNFSADKGDPSRDGEKATRDGPADVPSDVHSEDVPTSTRVRSEMTPLWREPDTYALLATAVATAASGNTGIGVGAGLVIAAATEIAKRGFHLYSAGGRAAAENAEENAENAR